MPTTLFKEPPGEDAKVGGDMSERFSRKGASSLGSQAPTCLPTLTWFLGFLQNTFTAPQPWLVLLGFFGLGPTFQLAKTFSRPEALG